MVSRRISVAAAAYGLFRFPLLHLRVVKFLLHPDSVLVGVLNVALKFFQLLLEIFDVAFTVFLHNQTHICNKYVLPSVSKKAVSSNNINNE